MVEKNKIIFIASFLILLLSFYGIFSMEEYLPLVEPFVHCIYEKEENKYPIQLIFNVNGKSNTYNYFFTKNSAKYIGLKVDMSLNSKKEITSIIISVNHPDKKKITECNTKLEKLSQDQMIKEIFYRINNLYFTTNGVIDLLICKNNYNTIYQSAKSIFQHKYISSLLSSGISVNLKEISTNSLCYTSFISSLYFYYQAMQKNIDYKKILRYLIIYEDIYYNSNFDISKFSEIFKTDRPFLFIIKRNSEENLIKEILNQNQDAKIVIISDVNKLDYFIYTTGDLIKISRIYYLDRNSVDAKKIRDAYQGALDFSYEISFPPRSTFERSSSNYNKYFGMSSEYKYKNSFEPFFEIGEYALKGINALKQVNVDTRSTVMILDNSCNLVTMQDLSLRELCNKNYFTNLEFYKELRRRGLDLCKYSDNFLNYIYRVSNIYEIDPILLLSVIIVDQQFLRARDVEFFKSKNAINSYQGFTGFTFDDAYDYEIIYVSSEEKKIYDFRYNPYLSVAAKAKLINYYFYTNPNVWQSTHLGIEDVVLMSLLGERYSEKSINNRAYINRINLINSNLKDVSTSIKRTYHLYVPYVFSIYFFYKTNVDVSSLEKFVKGLEDLSRFSFKSTGEIKSELKLTSVDKSFCSKIFSQTTTQSSSSSTSTSQQQTSQESKSSQQTTYDTSKLSGVKLMYQDEDLIFTDQLLYEFLKKENGKTFTFKITINNAYTFSTSRGFRCYDVKNGDSCFLISKYLIQFLNRDEFRNYRWSPLLILAIIIDESSGNPYAAPQGNVKIGSYGMTQIYLTEDTNSVWGVYFKKVNQILGTDFKGTIADRDKLKENIAAQILGGLFTFKDKFEYDAKKNWNSETGTGVVCSPLDKDKPTEYCYFRCRVFQYVNDKPIYKGIFERTYYKGTNKYALRGYNGWGCSQNAGEVVYVEKALDFYEELKADYRKFLKEKGVLK
ncbi:MAG: hypothetical protein QXS41_00600 [Candidatus Woesearchaeota archaeon]